MCVYLSVSIHIHVYVPIATSNNWPICLDLDSHCTYLTSSHLITLQWTHFEGQSDWEWWHECLPHLAAFLSLLPSFFHTDETHFLSSLWEPLRERLSPFTEPRANTLAGVSHSHLNGRCLPVLKHFWRLHLGSASLNTPPPPSIFLCRPCFSTLGCIPVSDYFAWGQLLRPPLLRLLIPTSITCSQGHSKFGMY